MGDLYEGEYPIDMTVAEANAELEAFARKHAASQPVADVEGLKGTLDFWKEYAHAGAVREDKLRAQVDTLTGRVETLEGALRSVCAEIEPAKHYAEQSGLPGGKLCSAVHIKLDLIDGYARDGLAALASDPAVKPSALAKMTALDEKMEAEHPGWMTGKASAEGGAA